jgi:hypothetical protein
MASMRTSMTLGTRASGVAMRWRRMMLSSDAWNTFGILSLVDFSTSSIYTGKMNQFTNSFININKIKTIPRICRFPCRR